VEFKGLLIGGLLPALAFGATGLLQKVTMRTGIGLGPYLLCLGLGVVIVGGATQILSPGSSRAVSLRTAALSGTVGASWGLGMALVALGLSRYGVPLSKLAPLYNLNTLVVVLLALVVFSEFREVAAGRLLAGTTLILLGAWLVGRA
jgi:hypothetical protein